MSDISLDEVVADFAGATQFILDADLNRPWVWKDYDSEGVRFAFFRIFEDLRQLAASLAEMRGTAGQPRSAAHQLLGNYHAAFRDLQAVFLGKDPKTFDRPPGAEEWSVRRTLAHIVGADMGFYVVLRYALDAHRTADARPARISDSAWDALLGMSEEDQDRLLKAPVADLAAYHETLHNRILAEFASLTSEELELPSYYWENEPYSLRFRLNRLESHMRQHTIQIEKVLAGLGEYPQEAQRLLRLIFAALAEVEAHTIGVPGLGAGLQGEVASVIRLRTREVAAALH